VNRCCGSESGEHLDFKRTARRSALKNEAVRLAGEGLRAWTLNPYESRSARRADSFRTVGETWPGGRKMSRIGAVLFGFGILGAFV